MSRKDVRTVRVEDLSFEQKVGQMLFGRTWKILDDPRYARMVECGWIGSVEVQEGWSRKEADRLNDALPIPVFTGANAEEGCWLPAPKGTPLPPACAVAALNSASVAEEMGRMAAREMMSEGINMVWGPVFDVNLLPGGVMSLRTYGNSMSQVVPLAAATVSGYLKEGMIATAKHYPGGCSHTAEDSHIVCPAEGQDLGIAERWDLRPYRAAMKAGLNGIMSTHFMVREGDTILPATFSRQALDLIRRAGFDGLIITDSLAMAGLRTRWSNAEILRMAMAAGHDLLMVDYQQDPMEAFEMMLHAARHGAITEEQLNRSVARILREKNRLARITTPVLSDAELAEHRRRAKEIAVQAVTVRNRHRLDLNGRHLVLFMACQRLSNSLEVSRGASNPRFAAAVRTVFPNSDFMVVSEWPVTEIEAVLRRASQAESVVIVAESLWFSYRGTARYSEPFLSLVRGVAHKVSAFVSMGDPNAVADLPPNIKNLIMPYSGIISEDAALEVLRNPERAQGRFALPTGQMDLMESAQQA